MVFQNLAILIINYNRPQDTIECLESLLRAGADLSQVTLVDNGSSDGSAAVFRQKYGSALEVVEAGVARGLPNGWNLGLRQILPRRPDWVLLMTNDTVVDEAFLVELQKAAQSQTRYAILSPLIAYFYQPERIWYLTSRLAPGTLLTINSYRGKPSRQNFPTLMESDFFTCCSLLVRRDVFEKAGLFDTSIFMYAEDSDFIQRTRLAGFRLAAVPAARLYHKVSVTLGKASPWSRHLRNKNLALFYRRYSRGPGLALTFLFILARTIFLTFTDLLGGHFDLPRPAWKGWLEGWTGPIR